MMGYTPVFGSQVRFVLLGGKEIGSETLLRWYVLHVLDAAVRDRHLHGHPLLAGPQRRRHQWAVVIGQRVEMTVRAIETPVTEIPEHLLKRAASRRARKQPLRPPGRSRRRTDAGASDAGCRRVIGRCRSWSHPRAPPGAPSRRARPKGVRRKVRRGDSGGGGGVAVQERVASSRRRHCAECGRSAGRRRSWRSHAAAADRRQERIDPGREGLPHRQGAHLAAPAGWPSSSPRWPARRSLFVFSTFVNAPLHAAGQPEPDAEPVESAVVLPRPARAADDVPPDGRRRHHPRCRD